MSFYYWPEKFNMNIAYVYLPGRLQRLHVSTGEGIFCLQAYHEFNPSEFYYGAFELQKQGHSVGLFEVIEKPRRSFVKFFAEKLLRKKYLPVKTYAGIIDAAYFLLPQLSQFDVVVATTPGIAFSLAIWKALGRFDRPVVAIQCGILNYSLNLVRVFLTRKLMRSMWSQLYGVGELAEMKRVYGVPADRIEVNCFGIDTSFWTPGNGGSEEEDYVLAIGNDVLRDFNTLIEAAKKSSTRVIIITKRQLPAHLPENVEVISGAWNSRELDDIALRELYRRAMVVVVPLKPSLQPSGQSVTLQAMACGKPVILSYTDGLWESTALVHKKNVFFVQPEQPDELSDALQEVQQDNTLRKRMSAGGIQYVVNRCQIGQFASRLEQLCRRVVSCKT